MITKELQEKLLSSVTGPIWKKIGTEERHGINIALFSIHTKKSCGIGEFLDLIPLIDWCKEIPLQVIQLLPINDTGNDPSPYNALSSCALHPIYLSLHALPYLNELEGVQSKLDELRSYNQHARVDYHQVRILKLYFLQQYIEKVGHKLIKEKEFSEFCKENTWLMPYALFKTIKSLLEQSHWQRWPHDLQVMSEDTIKYISSEYEEEIYFHLLAQYLCYSQLKKVKDYANRNKIFIKGDIPILISPDSSDVWKHTSWFDLSLAAGAPPDYYNKDGQYWGFPLFHWDQIEKDDFKFWKERLKAASQIFDMYRIDHIIGFFRIWGIPLNEPAKNGKFIPDKENLWMIQGKKLLEMIVRSSPMLPIGEDLGLIPPEVRKCMDSLGICGTKILRWERDWNKDSHFLPINTYPPISMSSVSTHDSETITLWWQKYPEEAKAYAHFKGWEYKDTLSREQRASILWDSHHSSSLLHINLLQEYLALFPELVSPNPDDERINIPGKVLPTNWTYRIKPSVEEISSHKPLLDAMKKILFSSDSSQSILTH